MAGRGNAGPGLGRDDLTVAAGLVAEEAETYAVLAAVISGHAAVCLLSQYEPARRPAAAARRLLPGDAGREGDRAGADPALRRTLVTIVARAHALRPVPGGQA